MLKASRVRKFEEWLNTHRDAVVSSVFHEIVAKFRDTQPTHQITAPVTRDQGMKLAEVVPACVYWDGVVAEPTVRVSADPLRQVLVALNGPGHYIRELQATRGELFDNPIDKLLKQFNEQVGGKANG